jgi:ADP-ribose pyrophosphatase YjhB (NUDIX family)|tara:strand:+ start:4687 stop:5226 length:540 start_codon:yes stop_codon:yes gene_type:complete
LKAIEQSTDSLAKEYRTMPPPDRYNTGYNVGVGGAVVDDGRLLLVRRSSRRGRGNWQIPGGFVEQNETMELAVVREVEEEAGVKTTVQGVLGIRNRYDEEGGNSLYIVMLLRRQSGEPNPDMKEVDRAEYFTLAEIQALEQISPVNIEVAKRALSKDHRMLCAQTVEQVNRGSYTLFIG